MFDLDRFVKAQERVFEKALGELRFGQKQSHWMWFVFPQLRGISSSSMGQQYGIASLAEARAYLEHPLLGPRLRQCIETVLALSGRTLHQIFDTPDDIKFRSSMTLFALATEDNNLFEKALDQYCGSAKDPVTLDLLGIRPPG